MNPEISGLKSPKRSDSAARLMNESSCTPPVPAYVLWWFVPLASVKSISFWSVRTIEYPPRFSP